MSLTMTTLRDQKPKTPPYLQAYSEYVSKRVRWQFVFLILESYTYLLRYYHVSPK